MYFARHSLPLRYSTAVGDVVLCEQYWLFWRIIQPPSWGQSSPFGLLLLPLANVTASQDLSLQQHYVAFLHSCTVQYLMSMAENLDEHHWSIHLSCYADLLAV